MKSEKTKPIIMNIMDSSLKDLEKKGVFSSISRLYNPNNAFARVFHFTPHEKDLELATRLDSSNIEILRHPVEGLSPIKALYTTIIMWRMIKKKKVDLVRGRLPYLGSLMGGVAAKLAKKPFVVSLGGDNRIVQEKNGIFNYNSKLISYTMEWLVLKLATAIIVPNKHTYKYVESIIGTGAAGNKSIRIPWISDPIEKTGLPIEDPRITDIPKSKKLVVIVGFLNRYKFTDVLYEALESILSVKKMPPIQFVFCGDGPLREEGELKFLNEDTVTFLGWTDRELVQQLMREAEVVLVPMSGFVLLEAASLGKPVITSNVEWHSEMVKNNDTGIVVQPDVPQEWQEALMTMLEDPEKASALGENLEALYLEQYSPTISIETELKLYERLIQGGVK